MLFEPGDLYDAKRCALDAEAPFLLGGERCAEYDVPVGEPGREVFRVGGELAGLLGDSPAAASVRRNSTQRREKD